MAGKNSQSTSIKTRLNKNLNKADRESITESLIDYMASHSVSAAELAGDDDLLTNLLPLLSKKNSDWEGITHVRELKSTEVKKRVFGHIRNLKKLGEKLNAKADAAKDPLVVESSNNSQDDMSQLEDPVDSTALV